MEISRVGVMVPRGFELLSMSMNDSWLTEPLGWRVLVLFVCWSLVGFDVFRPVALRKRLTTFRPIECFVRGVVGVDKVEFGVGGSLGSISVGVGFDFTGARRCPDDDSVRKRRW